MNIAKVLPSTRVIIWGTVIAFLAIAIYNNSATIQKLLRARTTA